MSLNRQTAKTLFKCLDRYESIKELVERASDPVKPSLTKSHGSNRNKLDDLYMEVVHSWKEFKRDINANGDVLNEKNEDGSSKYELDDMWMKRFKDEYCDLSENLIQHWRLQS